LTRPGFEHWLERLEQRHLADLTFAEVRRGLEALHRRYVAGRDEAGLDAGAFTGAGKRAAYAVFYAPLHWLTVARLTAELEPEAPAPRTVADLGCGTGAAGAAWAAADPGTTRVVGLDRDGWMLAEARRTFRDLGVRGSTRRADLRRPERRPAADAYVAGWVLNELPAPAREAWLAALLAAAARGARVLVVEPVARGAAPWWAEAAAHVRAAGGREGEWRFEVELPPLVARLDRAAGLDHRELTARALYLPAP